MKHKVIITGATGGLGLAVTKKLLKNNYEVLAFSKDITKKILALAEFSKFSDKNLLQQKYVDFNSFRINFAPLISAPDEYSDIIFCHGKMFHEDILSVSRDTLDESMRINFFSPFELIQYLLRTWSKTSKPRSITYISSVSAKTASPDEIAYHSAKRAMESTILSVARKFAEFKIRANVISPGIMNTKMGSETLARRPDIISRIPLNTLVDVNDIAEMTMTLLNTESITGQNIHINGGRYFTI